MTVRNPDGSSGTLRSGLDVATSIAECEHLTVHFGFDVHSLDSSARGRIEPLMACYQRGGSVTVEGHADERGTVDYNLALGQRRADAVREFLGSGGVSSSRIKTVSFGEERPANSGHTEAAWADNRRAELHASD